MRQALTNSSDGFSPHPPPTPMMWSLSSAKSPPFSAISASRSALQSGSRLFVSEPFSALKFEFQPQYCPPGFLTASSSSPSSSPSSFFSFPLFS